MMQRSMKLVSHHHKFISASSVTLVTPTISTAITHGSNNNATIINRAVHTATTTTTTSSCPTNGISSSFLLASSWNNNNSDKKRSSNHHHFYRFFATSSSSSSSPSFSSSSSAFSTSTSSSASSSSSSSPTSTDNSTSTITTTTTSPTTPSAQKKTKKTERPYYHIEISNLARKDVTQIIVSGPGTLGLLASMCVTLATKGGSIKELYAADSLKEQGFTYTGPYIAKPIRDIITVVDYQTGIAFRDDQLHDIAIAILESTRSPMKVVNAVKQEMNYILQQAHNDNNHETEEGEITIIPKDSFKNL